MPGAKEAEGAIDALVPAAAAAFPPVVGGGIFFESCVLIFSFSCFCVFSSPAIDQPFSIFGCATFVFTVGGAISFAALLIFIGAATTKELPCTFVRPPDLAAAATSTFVCRSD